jgi:hypothetical protein
MRETETGIPSLELALFADVVQDAVSLAVQGRLSEGYTGLLVGVEHALARQEAAEPWAPELVARWRAACCDYAQAFGVPLS